MTTIPVDDQHSVLVDNGIITICGPSTWDITDENSESPAALARALDAAVTVAMTQVGGF
jgi:hypothetical protein